MEWNLKVKQSNIYKSGGVGFLAYVVSACLAAPAAQSVLAIRNRWLFVPSTERKQTKPQITLRQPRHFTSAKPTTTRGIIRRLLGSGYLELLLSANLRLHVATPSSRIIVYAVAKNNNKGLATTKHPQYMGIMGAYSTFPP